MKPFSVVVAWRDRPELAKTLEANARFFRRHCDEVTIVNCGGDPEDVSRLASTTAIPGLRQVHVPDTPFNKSLANNIGTLCSSRPHLFFLDTDVILQSDVFAPARRLLDRGDCFLVIRRVYESRPTPREELRTVKEIVMTRKFVFNNGRVAYSRSYSGGDGSRWGAGLLLLRRADLIAIGGFNSAVTGWGFEDDDVSFRLQLALRLKLRAIGRVLHLSHGDERRHVLDGSVQKDYRRNLMLCADNYDREEFIGTYEQDGRVWRHRIRQICMDGHVAHSTV